LFGKERLNASVSALHLPITALKCAVLQGASQRRGYTVHVNSSPDVLVVAVPADPVLDIVEATVIAWAELATAGAGAASFDDLQPSGSIPTTSTQHTRVRWQCMTRAFDSNTHDPGQN
jgi:hypothetical protein